MPDPIPTARRLIDYYKKFLPYYKYEDLSITITDMLVDLFCLMRSEDISVDQVIENARQISKE